MGNFSTTAPELIPKAPDLCMLRVEDGADISFLCYDVLMTIFEYLHPLQWKKLELLGKDFRHAFIQNEYGIWRTYVINHMKGIVSPEFYSPRFKRSKFEDLQEVASEDPVLWKKIVVNYHYSWRTFLAGHKANYHRFQWRNLYLYSGSFHFRGFFSSCRKPKIASGNNSWTINIKMPDSSQFSYGGFHLELEIPEVLFTKYRHVITQFEDNELVEFYGRFKRISLSSVTLELTDRDDNYLPIGSYFRDDLDAELLNEYAVMTSNRLCYETFFVGKLVLWRGIILRIFSPKESENSTKRSWSKKNEIILQLVNPTKRMITTEIHERRARTASLISKNVRLLLDENVLSVGDKIDFLGVLTYERERISLLDLRVVEFDAKISELVFWGVCKTLVFIPLGFLYFVLMRVITLTGVLTSLAVIYHLYFILSRGIFYRVPVRLRKRKRKFTASETRLQVISCVLLVVLFVYIVSCVLLSVNRSCWMFWYWTIVLAQIIERVWKSYRLVNEQRVKEAVVNKMNMTERFPPKWVNVC